MLFSQSLHPRRTVRREPEILTSSALKPPRQTFIGGHMSQALCLKYVPESSQLLREAGTVASFHRGGN